MMPSLLPPMSMTTLSRCTATTVPRTISPSLPKSPALMLASKRLAKFSALLAVCSGVLPVELRAVVGWFDMGLRGILRQSAVRASHAYVEVSPGSPRLREVGPDPRWELPGALASSLPDLFCQRGTGGVR